MLKTREAKCKMPPGKLTNAKVEREANRSPGIGQRILTTLNSLAHTKNLLWYIILFLTMYAKHTYRAPVLHQASMPIAAHPTVWTPNQPTAPNLGTQSWNHTTGVYSPHSSNPTINTNISLIPRYSGSSVETPTYITVLITAGSLGAMIAGITALIHRLLRRDSSPPDQPGYEHQEEEEVRIRAILRKAAHLRSPMERVIFDRWSKRQIPFQL